jgi:hypothetical protein
MRSLSMAYAKAVSISNVPNTALNGIPKLILCVPPVMLRTERLNTKLNALKEATMHNEEAKVLLRSQIQMLTAEIMRQEHIIAPLNQELEALHRRVEELKHELVGL